MGQSDGGDDGRRLGERQEQQQQAAQLGDEALGRRSTDSCSCSKHSDSLPDGNNGSARSSRTGSRPHSRNASHDHSRRSSDKGDLAEDAYTPPPFSSPSVASSLAFSNPGFSSFSPLRRELSHTTLHDEVDSAAARSSRQDLARRLSQLAQRLTYGESDHVDELALGGQLDQLEKAVGRGRSPEPPRRPASFEMRNRSDVGSAFGSPVSPLIRSRFSDLSASWHREREAEREQEKQEPPPKMGMTVGQAKKVIAEMGKLNDELSTVVNNLRARQEESDLNPTDTSQHIHDLLIERAERAAQRIIFLQNRISYLEQELQENDDELQHLRICLKAVEIQMPPHPDRELQRCIANFKHDYQALKKKRANRASLTSIASFGSSTVGSPTR
ncbi:hypothetical protein TOPH_02649 [Tolypocladium ophioglossoides CBS 100239]|uniref:Uncharacterized protein n=1 Tax=Tolypocladium ophioglossoides (strain CBS 100239) TaxID=1163406 RepID=A0A0L0NET6_TOLOC|nr:hypothetical protein TOPH_02649 [Tolypocladium ophioglossoides CBS 100239]